MNSLKVLVPVTFLIGLFTMLTGCEVVGGIFKAGVWTGIIVVVAIVALIIYFISRARK